jgi:hypothetical protein
VRNTLVSRATEWIGWDPATSQVRSWSFVADGSIGENTWSNEGDQWIIETNVILPDGKKLAATNIITRNGPDAITWQSNARWQGAAGCTGNQDETRALRGCLKSPGRSRPTARTTVRPSCLEAGMGKEVGEI